MIGSALRTALTVACMVVLAGAHARTSDIPFGALPAQAKATLELIANDGPFPYSRDGTVFGNRERILPPQPRGYYREYTVKMPASRGRGAHRVVCGGDQRALRECYYSDDHYSSFRRVR